jgi:hypothetical protein
MRQLYLRDGHGGFGRTVSLKAQNAVRINNGIRYERVQCSTVQFQMETLLLRIIHFLTQRCKKIK